MASNIEFTWEMGVDDIPETLPKSINDEEVDDDEIAYYQSVEEFFKMSGTYEAILGLQGTDEEFCTATLKLQKAAYETGQTSRFAAVSIIESTKKYLESREYGIWLLESTEDHFRDEDDASVTEPVEPKSREYDS